jgi:hypothetical protein
LAERSNTGRSPLAAIVAAIAALLLVYVIVGPALAQTASPSPEASPAATEAASPAGAPQTPSGTQPETATGGDPRVTGDGGATPIAFLLLGIFAVAGVLVYLGMRGSQLRRQPADSDRNPPL